MNNTTSAILYTYKYALDNFGKDILINNTSTRGIIKQVGDKDKLITNSTIKNGDYVTIDNDTYLITSILENFEQDIYNECYIEPTQDVIISKDSSTNTGTTLKALVSYDRLNILYETYTTAIDEIIMATIPTQSNPIQRGQGLIFDNMMFEVQNIDTTKEGLVTLYAKYKKNVTHAYEVIYPALPTSIDVDATVSIDIPTFTIDGVEDPNPTYDLTTTNTSIITATLNTNTNKIDLYGISEGSASIKITYKNTTFTSSVISVASAITYSIDTDTPLDDSNKVNKNEAYFFPLEPNAPSNVTVTWKVTDTDGVELDSIYYSVAQGDNTGFNYTSAKTSYNFYIHAYIGDKEIAVSRLLRGVNVI